MALEFFNHSTYHDSTRDLGFASLIRPPSPFLFGRHFYQAVGTEDL